MTEDQTGSFTQCHEVAYRISYTAPDRHQAGGWCAFAPGFGLRCNYQKSEDALADLQNYFQVTN